MADEVEVSTHLKASPRQVWAALTDPKIIKSYFFGADVESDWTPGSSIRWNGEYEGKSFSDKGQIIDFDPPKRLELTHWSPLSGLEDKPANYHTLVWDVREREGGSDVTLTQRNLTGVEPDKARKSWQPVLDGLKRTLEG